MAEVYIALGSNLDDRAANLARAQEALSAVVRIDERSSVHETQAAYVENQPNFLNMVLRGETDLPAQALLQRLKVMERSLGRRPSKRFGPRLIDLDLLYYEDAVIESAELTVPHPRIAERRFVLEPMLEIAPDKRHPVTGISTRQMVAQLNSRE